MTWQYLTLGDVITLKRGYDLPTNKRSEGDIPVISSSGTSGWHSNYKCVGEGVITGRYGTLGEVFYVNGEYWPLNTTLYVGNFKGNYPKFIFYYLKIIGLERFNGAAAVPGLDRNILHRVKIKFPIELSIQKKIANILSTYDELIENNTQRIKLLEETAEELYKEWFVRMRFPGYQEATFLNENGEEVPHSTAGALPEGWEKKNAASFYNISIGKTPPRKESHWFSDKEGVKWISIKDINNSSVFIYDTSERISEEGVEKHNVKIVPKGTVVLSFKLTVGKVIIVTDEMVTNEAIAHFVPKYDIPVWYTFLYLKLFQYQKLGNTSSIGTAINSKVVKGMPFVLPDANLLHKADSALTSIFQEIDILSQKNQLLRETRDLLLPRLMSGKLDVSRIKEDLNERRRHITETAVA